MDRYVKNVSPIHRNHLVVSMSNVTWNERRNSCAIDSIYVTVHVPFIDMLPTGVEKYVQPAVIGFEIIRIGYH